MNITLEEAVRFSPSERCDYPEVFTDNCGLDLEAISGYHIEKAWRKGKRKAVLKLNTWRGISGGAIHYYGKILIDGVQFVNDAIPNQTTWSSSINEGLLNWEYELELKRVITQQDIDNHPKKWRSYYLGELTNCFDTIKDLKELAAEIFRLRFSGDWEFYVEDFYGKRIKFVL